MTEEQLDLLIKYINAKIAEHAAENHSDGALVESIIANNLEYDLRFTLRLKESE